MRKKMQNRFGFCLGVVVLMGISVMTQASNVLFGVNNSGSGQLWYMDVSTYTTTKVDQGLDTFESMVPLLDGDAYTGVSWHSGALIRYNATSGTWANTGEGYDTFQQMVTLIGGNVLAGTKNTSTGFTTLRLINATTNAASTVNTGFDDFQAMTALLNGDALIGVGASSRLYRYNAVSNDLTQIEQGFDGYQVMQTLSTGDVLMGVDWHGDSIVRYNAATGNWTSIEQYLGSEIEVMTALPNGDAICGEGGRLIRYNNSSSNLSTIATGFGTFQTMVTLTNGDVLFGCTTNSALWLMDGDTYALTRIESGFDNYQVMTALDNGDAIFGVDWHDGALIRYNAATQDWTNLGEGYGDFEQMITLIPEPMTCSMMMFGSFGLMFYNSRKR